MEPQTDQLMIYSTGPCPFCNAEGSVKVYRSEAERYQQGAFVQDAFARLSEADRELIISGTHPACWNRAFGSPE